MKNVKVSVIIPVYDIPSEMLKDCAQSLLNQTLEDMEFIFINDNSPNTQNKSYLLALQKEDPRVVFIDLSQNKGVSNARNEGLQKRRVNMSDLLMLMIQLRIICMSRCI